MKNIRPDVRSRLEQARLLAPERTDRDHVRTIAAQVVDTLGVVAPPVDVDMVASLLGIGRVVDDADLPVAGCLRHLENDDFEIRVRASDPLGRRRFTVAHECTHTFFPGYAQQVQYRCAPESRPRETHDIESLCDLGAGELLLPARLFAPDVREAPFCLHGLRDLADRYQASLEATANHLVGIWPEPAALLILAERQKPAERGTSAPPRLRLNYAHRRGPWPYFLPHKSVRSGDPLDRARQGEEVCETATVDSVCTQPVRVEIHACGYPVETDGAIRQRVLALLRRPGYRVGR